MRTLLFILVLVFSVSAQDHFAEATNFALNGQYEKALSNYRAAQIFQRFFLSDLVAVENENSVFCRPDP